MSFAEGFFFGDIEAPSPVPKSAVASPVLVHTAAADRILDVGLDPTIVSRGPARPKRMRQDSNDDASYDL